MSSHLVCVSTGMRCGKCFCKQVMDIEGCRGYHFAANNLAPQLSCNRQVHNCQRCMHSVATEHTVHTIQLHCEDSDKNMQCVPAIILNNPLPAPMSSTSTYTSSHIVNEVFPNPTQAALFSTEGLALTSSGGIARDSTAFFKPNQYRLARSGSDNIVKWYM